MSNNLRFPSGRTVAQAKKDAKALASRESLRLHQAQDVIARRNGLKLPWAKALAWLRQQSQPLMSFRLPLDHERGEGATHHVLDLYPEASTAVIVGTTGTGKTVLALELARQSLAANAPAVHYCAPEGMFGVSLELGRSVAVSDLSTRQLLALRSAAPARFYVHQLSRNSAPTEALPDLRPGTVVLVDELAYLARSQAELVEWMTWAQERQSVLILVTQSPMDGVSRAALEQYVGALFMGKAVDAMRAVPNPTDEVALLIRANRELRCRPGEYSEFMVVGTRPEWAGFVRLPSPTLPN